MECEDSIEEPELDKDESINKHQSKEIKDHGMSEVNKEDSIEVDSVIPKPDTQIHAEIKDCFDADNYSDNEE